MIYHPQSVLFIINPLFLFLFINPLFLFLKLCDFEGLIVLYNNFAVEGNLIVYLTGFYFCIVLFN